MKYDTEKFILSQLEKYPKLQIQDVLKGLHQSFFGCGHFVDREKGFAYLKHELGELLECETGKESYVEPLDGNFCRIHLDILRETPLLPETLFNVFTLSSEVTASDCAGIEEMLKCFLELCKAGKLPFHRSEAEKQVKTFREAGFPACHHSEAFRQAYSPAYRVVRREYCEILPLLIEIDRLAAEKDNVIVAIDGRCASGKTTVAERLKRIYNCNVFHMDDFFLQPFQRTPERLSETGGNVDRERVLEEVLEPLSEGKEFCYRPYDCHEQKLMAGIFYRPSQINIIEGSYSMHPLLSDKYDFAVFVDVDSETQKERILKRNGPEMLKRFTGEWIVLEEAYFKGMDVESRCNMKLRFDGECTADNVLSASRRDRHEGCCN